MFILCQMLLCCCYLSVPLLHNSMPSVGKPFFLVKLSCPATNLTTSIVVQVGFNNQHQLSKGCLMMYNDDSITYKSLFTSQCYFHQNDLSVGHQ